MFTYSQKTMVNILCISLLMYIHQVVHSYQAPILKSRPTGCLKNYGSITAQKWDDFETIESKALTQVTVLPHLGDYDGSRNDEGTPFNAEYNLNVGKALDTLRRELPICFYTSNLDFSIFAHQITLVDGYQNKMSVSKSIYCAAIRSLRVASAISSIYPSMNVRKIEYIDESRTIQCLVDVVLPDSVRIDGQSVWEGMFYFGVDQDGLIDTHVFDRKVSNMKPAPLKAYTYPWIRNSPSWTPELLRGGFLRPVPQPSFAVENTNELVGESVDSN